MRHAALPIALLHLTCILACAQSTAEAPVGEETPAIDKEAITAASPSKLVAWKSFDEAVAAAKESGKIVLVDIYAPWCGWCARMQKDVYTQARIASYVNEHFEIGRLNIDDAETRHAFKGYDVTSQQLSYGLGAQGTPTTVFLDSNGDYITRLPGFMPAEDYISVLEYIGTEAFRNQSYKAFIEATGESVDGEE